MIKKLKSLLLEAVIINFDLFLLFISFWIIIDIRSNQRNQILGRLKGISKT